MPGDADFLADVLAYIDAHLLEPINVAELAAAAGFSPYHFSRMFLARFGVTAIDYVRGCRLQAAASRLTGDEPPTLIDLAFDCGFESQEAFTRAFRRRFGVPPGQYKREAAQPMETNMTDTALQTRVEMLPGVTHRGAFSIAGVAAIFEEANKSGIPALWPRLVAALPLPSQVDARSYGVVQAVDEGKFRYMAGVEIKGEATLPDSFDRIDLDAHDYAVFRITLDGTALHPQIQGAMAEIWGKLLPQSGLKAIQAPDFELCPADFEPMRKGQTMEFYIAVES